MWRLQECKVTIINVTFRYHLIWLILYVLWSTLDSSHLPSWLFTSRITNRFLQVCFSCAYCAWNTKSVRVASLSSIPACASSSTPRPMVFSCMRGVVLFQSAQAAHNLPFQCCISDFLFYRCNCVLQLVLDKVGILFSSAVPSHNSS